MRSLLCKQVIIGGSACGVAGSVVRSRRAALSTGRQALPVLQGVLFLPGSEDLPGGVIKGVTVPVHDLPHVIFPAKYRSDAQRIAVQIPAQTGGDGALDRGNIAKIAAHTCAQDLIVTGLAAGEAGREAVEHRLDLTPAAPGELSTEEGDRVVV